jgi:uncharacterized protein DUF6166
MRIMPPITGPSRQAGVLDAFAAHMQKTRKQRAHLHRTGVVKASNYYAGHHKAQGVRVTVTRSGRTKPLDPRYDLRNNSPTGFAWGYNGSGPAQLALAILTDYFGAKPGGKALAEALYEPFKFTLIAALPECWEEVGIALHL